MSGLQPIQPLELDFLSQPAEEVPIEETFSYVQERLQQSLTSVYDSTRLANEITGLESKLNSLVNIRQTLIRDNNKPQAGIQSMDTTIRDLESQIEGKKTEMNAAEQLVVKGFQDIAKHILEISEKKIEIISKGFRMALEKFGAFVNDRCVHKMNALEATLATLNASKMDVTEKDTITRSIESLKSNLVEVQTKNFTKMHHASIEHFTKMNQRMDAAIAKVNPQTIKNQVENKIVSNLDSKFTEYLEKAKEQNALMNQQRNVPDKVAEFVKNEIRDQISPAHLQNIITSLPEFQALKQMRDTLPASVETAPDFDSIKSLIMNLSSELADLKQRSNSTRAIVDTLRTQGLPTNESNAIEFDKTAALKHMEEMERDVSMIHNSIKMIEAVVSVKSKSLEDANSAGSSTKKRPRLEDTVASVVDGEISNNVILAKLNDIETKHQKLIDFIFQCKDTVLDDMFPTRLEAAMKKIERVLLNHETFISYIIDPFSTSKRTTSIPAEPSAEASTNNDFSSLNPAMLDAITQLVKQTAEEISLPLQKRIKFLEDKLEARQQ